MEQLVSDVDRVVNTTKGHSVHFKASVPRTVPESIKAECFAAGIKPSEGKPKATPETPSGPSARDVATAMREIIESGDDEKLTAQGKVRVEAVNAAMGEDVPSATRRQADRMLERGEA